VAKAWEEEVRTEIKSMLELGVIEPCRSPWASPIVTVAKKDGSLRLCIDYRKLNSVTADDPYQMPRVEEMLDRLGQAEFISTIDLAKGYYQVPVRKEDQDKTAFISPFGKYRFTRMPFGLKGAPTTFQRLMDSILDGLQDSTSAYIDDIVIRSVDWKSHCEHLIEVLSRLRRDGLTAKPRKCQLGMRTCGLLGHVVGKGQVAPEDAKVVAIRDFQRPLTKADVRAFLGLAGYYRRFIPNFSGTAAPLSDLTRAVAPSTVIWSSTCEEAFQKLKTALSVGPVLTSPDYSRQFVLQTDASERGVGAVLSHWDDQGVDRPVAYYSRKLLPRESRYATIEKECLAIVAGLKHFEPYLLGRSFVIQTDHRALQYLQSMRSTNQRLMRWALLLQQFQFTVTYRPGTANNNADGLSRQAWESQCSSPAVLDMTSNPYCVATWKDYPQLGIGHTVYRPRQEPFILPTCSNPGEGGGDVRTQP
jgi:hypothetical protein